jgi:hypothetical protein
MDNPQGFPGALTEISSGWSAAELDLIPGEGFWARIEQIAVKGEMTRGLDAAMKGQSSPRIWLFLHEPGRGELSTAVAMSFARELAFRDQATLLLDGDDQDQALTRWAGRLEKEGWIDLARYGTSVLTSGVAMPFVGRRGYLLGVGSFAPTEVTGDEIDSLLTRLRRQADDLLLVAPADSLGRRWAPAAGIRIFCWDRETLSPEDAAALTREFSAAGCPLTAVATFQETAVEEQLVEDVLTEMGSRPGVPETATPETTAAADSTSPEEPAAAREPHASVASGDDVKPFSAPDDDAADDHHWQDRPLEKLAAQRDDGRDEGKRDRSALEVNLPPVRKPGTSRVFWYGALAAVILIVVIAAYYFKYVRVPSEGRFGQIDIASEILPVGTRSEEEAATLPDQGERPSATVAFDSVAVAADEPGKLAASRLDTVVLTDSVPVSPPSRETATAGIGQDEESPTETAVIPPPLDFDMSPYREPVGDRGWALHVYSLADSAGTAEQVRELDRRGFRSEVRVFDLGSKGIWHRIYLGSFATRAEAKAAMPALLEKLRVDWAKPERLAAPAAE